MWCKIKHGLGHSKTTSNWTKANTEDRDKDTEYDADRAFAEYGEAIEIQIIDVILLKNNFKMTTVYNHNSMVWGVISIYQVHYTLARGSSRWNYDTWEVVMPLIL